MTVQQMLHECGLMRSRARRGGTSTASAQLLPRLREHRLRVAATALAQLIPSPTLLLCCNDIEQLELAYRTIGESGTYERRCQYSR